MNLRLFLKMLLGFFFAISGVWAGDDFPVLKVVPWNGHKAATSLTFDDSDPSHLDVAIPELNRRNMRGTFFLIANRTDRKDEWRKILLAGHEIGNHTLDHPHPAEMTASQMDSQVVGAHHVLQKEFGVAVRTFAYPYGEVTPSLEALVAQDHLLARGAGGLVVRPDSEPDWMNIPSRATLSLTPFKTYQQWIEEDVKAGGWLVWMIHGLEGTPWGYQPLSRKIFTQILDSLQSKDIWVGTFLEVGSYLRAQKIFEKCATEVIGQEKRFHWLVPDHFPVNVVLKIRFEKNQPLPNEITEIRQGRQKILPDTQGVYSIAFDQKEITLRLLPKR